MPTPFYRKTCQAEDLWVEVKPKLKRIELSLDRLITVAVDNQGESELPYDEIAADHIVYQLSKINDLLDYKA